MPATAGNQRGGGRAANLPETLNCGSKGEVSSAVQVRYHRDMDDITNTKAEAAPAGWIEALARSEADLAAGRLVSGEVVMERLHRTIAEMEVEEAQRTGRPDQVVPGR